MRRVVGEVVEPPSIQGLNVQMKRMNHKKGAARDEQLRARALKLCQDVVGPQYLLKLRDKYEPVFKLHVDRQATQLATLNSYERAVAFACLHEVRWSLKAIKGPLKMMSTSENAIS